MKLRTALLASLMGISSIASAEEVKESINVNVTDEEGKVIIIKGVNGAEKTIQESFSVDKDTDIDAVVSALLTKHGIDQSKSHEKHQVTKMMNHHGKNMLWVQKNNDVNVNLENGQATVVIKSDNNGEIHTIEKIIDIDDDTDIDVLIDELMAEHGIEAGEAGSHRKVIKIDKSFVHIDDKKPRMGFMANVKDNGWEIMSIVADSGAAEAGMAKGDVVIEIDGQSTSKEGLGLTEFIAMDHQAGQYSDVTVLRDGKEIQLEVEAKVLDSPDIVMDLDGNHQWFSSSSKDFKFNSGDLDGLFEGLNVDVEHLEKMVEGLGDHNIRVVTTGDADAYFFAGSKMNQWLGGNHHFSTMTETLGRYFGTSQGVLVLEVDENNKLGLRDGDVIQSINGKDVKSPKDVVKIMSGFKSDESFEIEIIREKETLYLES